jgi:hypothetical protein
MPASMGLAKNIKNVDSHSASLKTMSQRLSSGGAGELLGAGL